MTYVRYQEQTSHAYCNMNNQDMRPYIQWCKENSVDYFMFTGGLRADNVVFR